MLCRCIGFLCVLPFFGHVLFGQQESLLSQNYKEKINYYEDNNVDSAIYYVNLLLQATSHLPLESKVEIYFKAGQIYDDASLFEEALGFYNELLLTNVINSSQKALLISELIELYSSIRDFDKAYQFIEQAKSMIQAGGLSNDVLISLYFDFGTASWMNNQYQDAVEYLEVAVGLARVEELIDSNQLFYILSELGQCYTHTNDLNRANQILSEMQMAIDSGNVSLYARGSHKFLTGLIWLKQDRFYDSEVILKDVLTIARELGAMEEQSNVLDVLIEVAQGQMNYENAFNYKLIQDSIQTEIRKVVNQRRIEILEVQYGLSQQQTIIQNQQRDLAQRDLQFTLIGIILLVIVISFLVMLLFYRKIQDKNRLLEEQKDRIELLLRELHHRVKNNLQVVSSILGLQSMQLTDVNAKMAVDESKSRVLTMSLIHQMLYRKEDVSTVNLKDYIEKLIRDIVNIYGFQEKLDLQMSVANEEWNVDTALPVGLMLNEIVTNSLKYAYQDIDHPELIIEVGKVDDKIHVYVKDNGRSKLTAEQLQNSDSFGHKLIKLLVGQLNGEMDVNHLDGMEFNISLQAVA